MAKIVSLLCMLAGLIYLGLGVILSHHETRVEGLLLIILGSVNDA